MGGVTDKGMIALFRKYLNMNRPIYAKPHQIKHQYKTEMSIIEQVYWNDFSMSDKLAFVWLAVKLTNITE